MSADVIFTVVFCLAVGFIPGYLLGCKHTAEALKAKGK
jgi:hypothetical protein